MTTPYLTGFHFVGYSIQMSLKWSPNTRASTCPNLKSPEYFFLSVWSGRLLCSGESTAQLEIFRCSQGKGLKNCGAESEALSVSRSRLDTWIPRRCRRSSFRYSPGIVSKEESIFSSSLDQPLMVVSSVVLELLRVGILEECETWLVLSQQE
jgi:hypothetical protein